MKTKNDSINLSNCIKTKILEANSLLVFLEKI